MRLLWQILLLSIFSQQQLMAAADRVYKEIYRNPQSALKMLNETDSDIFNKEQQLLLRVFIAYAEADIEGILNLTENGFRASILSDLSIAAELHCYTSFAFQSKDDYQKAKIHLNLCEDLALNSGNDRSKAAFYETNAFYLFEKGAKSEALKAIIKGEQFASRSDKYFHHHILNSKGVLLNQLEYTDRSLPILEQAHRFFLQEDAPYFTDLVRYNLIAGPYNKYPEKGIQLLTEMIRKSQIANDLTNLPYLLNTRGGLYFVTGQVDKHLEDIESGLSIAREHQLSNLENIMVFELIGAYVARENWEKAEEEFRRFNVESKESVDIKTKFYGMGSRIYAKLQDYQTAHTYLRKYVGLRDFDGEKQEQKQLARLQVELNLAEEEGKRKLAEKELETQQEKARAERKASQLMIIIVVILSLLGALAVVLHHMKKLSVKLKKEVARQTRDIKSILETIKQGFLFSLAPA